MVTTSLGIVWIFFLSKILMTSTLWYKVDTKLYELILYELTETKLKVEIEHLEMLATIIATTANSSISLRLTPFLGQTRRSNANRLREVVPIANGKLTMVFQFHTFKLLMMLFYTFPICFVWVLIEICVGFLVPRVQNG